MTLSRSRRDPGGAKASAQMFHHIDHRSAERLTFSLVIAKATRPFAASRHNCFAFAPEGLCLDRGSVRIIRASYPVRDFSRLGSLISILWMKRLT